MKLLKRRKKEAKIHLEDLIIIVKPEDIANFDGTPVPLRLNAEATDTETNEIVWKGYYKLAIAEPEKKRFIGGG